MKKYVLLFALSLAMLSGCAQTTPSDTLSSEEHCFAPITYTFSGECDDIALTDGRLSLNPSTTCNEKETLDAGTLIIKNKPPFQNVTAMRASMYLLDNNKRNDGTTTTYTLPLELTSSS